MILMSLYYRFDEHKRKNESFSEILTIDIFLLDYELFFICIIIEMILKWQL